MIAFLDPPHLHQWAAIERGLDSATSVLDIGCGRGAHIRNHDFFKDVKLVGFDASRAWTNDLPAIYSDVIIGTLPGDLAGIPDNTFDAVMAIDVIEHFERSDALKLLDEMNRIARRVVVIATPNGYVYQPPAPDNEYNEHKSGWSKSDLSQLGFSSISGHFGFRWLRGSFGLPRLRPANLGYFLAALTARPCRFVTSLNYQLVATKLSGDQK